MPEAHALAFFAMALMYVILLTPNVVAARKHNHVVAGWEFSSALASRFAGLGALGCLGALGFIPGWERLLGFMGFFGLLGVAYIVEAFGRFRNPTASH